MQKETYHFEIKELTAQFVAAFNDVVIRRYNEDRDIDDKIHVSFSYAPKTRTLHDIINKAQHIKLPVISVFPSGFQRDVNRVFNKIQGPYYPSKIDPSGHDHLLQPVPINFNINMSIITRFQDDLDQILSNWIPYCDPYIVISWEMPYTGLELRSTVIWNGNVSIQDPKDITSNTAYRWIADTSFEVQGWLFKNRDSTAGKIYKITSDFVAASAIFNNYDFMKEYENILNTETFTISAQPKINSIDPYIVAYPYGPNTFQIYGDMYDWVTNIYVSGSNSVFDNMTLHDPASSNPSISAIYPPFSGVEVENWKKYSNNMITFTMPSASNSGNVDVIAFNEAGYSSLINDSVRPTLNPYPSSSPEYFNYVEYQPPFANGVEIIVKDL